MLDIQYQLPTLPRLVTGDGDGAEKHHFEANLIDREAVNCFPILLSVAATAATVAAGTLAVRDSYGISRLDILMVIRDSEPNSLNERSIYEWKSLSAFSTLQKRILFVLIKFQIISKLTSML